MKKIENYYDGGRLLSLKDLTGEKPSIFMVVGNRAGGKTYYFKRLLLRHHVKTGRKFIILLRFVEEIELVNDDFFKDVLDKEKEFTEIMSIKKRGKYMQEFFYGESSCGYVLPLNSADKIKRMSHLFADVDEIFFDEFQLEGYNYLKDEVGKMLSVLSSVSRGGKDNIRYVPLYMASNPINAFNPYYTSLDIMARLYDETNFLRGDGWVFEKNFNEHVAGRLSTAGFIRAFKGNRYGDISTQKNKYLMNAGNFIELKTGNCRPVATIVDNDIPFGIWSGNNGIIYVDKTIDKWSQQYVYNSKEHTFNRIKMPKSVLNILANAYNEGCVRFSSEEVRAVFLTFIGDMTFK